MTRALAVPDARRYQSIVVELARDWHGLALAWVIGLVSALIYVTKPDVLWPIFDDSFISLTFAKNLAENGMLSFDGESWSTGATSPLHVLAMATLLKFGVEPMHASVFVGVISHAFLASAVYLLAWSILRSKLIALLAATAIAFNNYAAMDAGNGLETSMFMALVSFTMASFFLGKTPQWRLATGTLTAVSVLTRPEAGFLVPAFLAYSWFDRDRRTTPREFALDAARLALPAMAAFGMLNLYSLAVSGSLGGTASAKMHFFQENDMALRDRIGFAADVTGKFVGPLLALVVLAFFSERRREFLLFAYFWAPAFALYTLAFPGGLEHYFFRYQHPVLPLLVVLAASGVMQIAAWAARGGASQKLIAVASVLAVIFVTEQHYERWRDQVYTQAVLETRYDLAGMAEDLNTIVRPGEVLATHDVGAIGYYAEYEVMDLVGLVNPDVQPFQEGRRVKEYVELTRPDYLLIFPDWDFYYLHIYPGEDARFELIRQYPGNVIRELPYLLYRISWDQPAQETVLTAPATP